MPLLAETLSACEAVWWGEERARYLNHEQRPAYEPPAHNNY